ncbi:fibronectin type III domain-containing protein [Lysinibacillus xylanilyticus]|uniref:fibronectin type III domain-containing protein n=1 Tax=Lysinibacillus xylanilyticus TaxID=582475 RepID=UPI00381F0348
MKKIVIILIFMSVFIGYSENAKASDISSYFDGYFDKNKGNYKGNPKFFDNDINTFDVLYPASVTEIVLNKEEEISIAAFFATYTQALQIRFIDAKGKETYRWETPVQGNPGNYWDIIVVNLDKVKVKKIALYTRGTSTQKLYEFELFDYVPKFLFASPENLTAKNHLNKVDLSWKEPKASSLKVTSYKIFKDDVQVATVNNNVTKYQINNLKPNTKYKFSVVAQYNNDVSPAVEINTTTLNYPSLDKEKVQIKEVTNNRAIVSIDLRNLAIKPSELIFYNKDGSLLDKRKFQDILDYRFLNLESGKKYEYYFMMDFDGNVSPQKIPIDFETKEPLKEVTNLTAQSDAVSVNLEWTMPDYKMLDFARIYRKKNDAGFFARMFKKEDTYEALFETNGTTFKDLTVKADTEYKYKVTTVDTSKNETTGKTIEIRTKKMSASGGGTEKDENGDYVITWTSPTTGKIKVLINGVEYAVVPASDKKIIIPKDKMKFDIIGNPDVLLIPIDDDGNEGVPTKPGAGEGTGNGGGIGDIVGGSGLAEMLSPGNILKGGMGLVLLVASILLLRMAFILVPKLIRIIRNALSRNNENTYERRRM